MSKKKHGRKRGLAGLGNISGAGALGRDVLPGLLGIGLTIGGAIAVRSFVRPDPGAMAAVYRNAPLIGMGAGVVGAGVVYMATKKRAGAGPAIGVASISILSGAFVLGMEKLNAARPGAMSAIADVAPSLPAEGGTTAGMRGLVAETRTARQLRGVVMEPGGMRGPGDFGDSVNAPVRGAVNPSAFGRPQSNMNG